MTTTPLPPHVISTDHPNHPSEGWSIAEMVWIGARDKIFQAYATQARADLEAENKRLREALLDCKTNARKEGLVKRIVDLALEKQP